MNLERARFEANLVSKAARMKQEGYRILPDPCRRGWWLVIRPDRAQTYSVNTEAGGVCSCPLFGAKQLCHHLLAVRQEEETRWLDTLVTEYEERIAQAESDKWGCDEAEEGNWPIF